MGKAEGIETVFLELEKRGLIYDISDKNQLFNLPKGSSFYLGFDPTAPSLQIGNLVGIIFSYHLARAGLSPIILFGGATGMIGDPSGKSDERKLLSYEQVQNNIAIQQKQISDIFNRLGLTEVVFVNNIDWFKGISFLDFLRDIGKHFTVNYMIAKDSIKSRLEGSGISFTEFSYMLLQAFDFFYLYSNKECFLQIGGSDQWGNITAGLELIRKKLGEHKGVALSYPLITDKSGKKFGKSEDGAIWLDSKLTSPYQLHQFLLNLDDDTALKLGRIFSLEPLSKIEEVEFDFKKSPESRLLQKFIADGVTDLVYGRDKTEEAKKCAMVLFGGSIQGLSDKAIEDIFKEAPSYSLSLSKVDSLPLIDLFVESGAVPSKGEAKRLLKSGGLYVNNERVEESQAFSTVRQFLREGSFFLPLRVGKKRHYLIKLLKDG